MSHTALRRVMIRLLHDSQLVAALHADAEQALAGVDLTARERGWLLQQPAAAWRADPARPARVLAALAEEFPASVARATERAAGFLRSPQFHRAIQERGSLALAFGDHLAEAADPRAVALACLERAVAEVRRAPRAPAASPAGRLRLSPRAVVLRAPRGALALLEAVRRGEPEPGLAAEEEPVLIALAPGADEVTLEALEPALAGLLTGAVGGCDRDVLLAEARSHGARPGEDAEIVDRLVAEGVLL